MDSLDRLIDKHAGERATVIAVEASGALHQSWVAELERRRPGSVRLFAPSETTAARAQLGSRRFKSDDRDFADDPAHPTATCTTRRYTFDKNGNRTRLTTTPGAADGTCSTTTTGTTHTCSHDSADRITSTSGYSYDVLGRALTIPAADTPTKNGNITLGYYDTDAARTITQNGQTVTYSLDPAGRRLGATTAAASGGTPTRAVVRHYVDGSDNPGWVEETVGGTTTITRYAESLGGDLAATITGANAQLILVNLHGDIVTTVDLPATGAATGIGAWNDDDEYGNVRTGGGADPVKYGWLGDKQRSADTAGTGLILMGVRLYNPTTGQCTSVDPVVGGNETSYNYPNDPSTPSTSTVERSLFRCSSSGRASPLTMRLDDLRREWPGAQFRWRQTRQYVSSGDRATVTSPQRSRVDLLDTD